MAETSRGRVTITLGRSGQVVKRAASASDVSLGDPMPAVGTKRSVRDRLGRSNEDSHLINGSLFVGSSKRQRGDMGTLSSGADRFDDVHMDKDDLRLKLMRKNASRRAHSNDNQKPKDLRDKLKKTARYPISTIESQRHVPETKEMGGFGQMPSRRSADDLPQMDSHRNSYSPWPGDHFRRRSPDRVPVTSRGLSLQSVDEVRRRPSGKTFEDARSVPYMSKNVTDTTRPMTSVAFQPSAALSPGSLKPVASPHLGQVPPSSGVVSKSSYMVDEQQTVDGLLHSLGLGKYVVIFKAEEVDMTALKQMGENDLKELGIPMGPRKKILLALLPRSKRQP